MMSMDGAVEIKKEDEHNIINKMIDIDRNVSCYGRCLIYSYHFTTKELEMMIPTGSEFLNPNHRIIGKYRLYGVSDQ